MREVLQLIVDGKEPDLLRDMLQTCLVRAILPQQETRCRMIIEAMMAIQSGDNPGVIRHKMATFYLASSDAMQDNDRSVDLLRKEVIQLYRFLLLVHIYRKSNLA